MTGLVFAVRQTAQASRSNTVLLSPDIPLHIPAGCGWTTLGPSVGPQPSFLTDSVSGAWKMVGVLIDQSFNVKFKRVKLCKSTTEIQVFEWYKCFK